MKIFFKGLTDEREGLMLLAKDLGFEASSEAEAEVKVEVTEREARGLELALNGKNACISYGGGRVRFYRAMAELIQALNGGKSEFHKAEAPLFEVDGAMVDVSRNAVMKVDFVKFYLRKMALMGLNSFMLYTEDTYEIKNRPYFGHLRGRYTQEELKEIDDYAYALGIEVVPCIQVLGHLRTMLGWNCAAPYRDTATCLLVGAEETYKIINDMLDTVEACFRSKRIHIGMDETHDLGLGGYLRKNGFTERAEIYMKHLNRLEEIFTARGFKPLFWGDMIFDFACKNVKNPECFDARAEFTEDIVKLVPKSFTPVFWDYYHTSEDFYTASLEKCKLFGEDTVFAGGVWCWMGFGVHFKRTWVNTLPALNACKKCGTKQVYATVWHNAAESSIVLSLAGLALYASYDYENGYNEQAVKACFAAACNASLDDFTETEKIAYPKGNLLEDYLDRVLLYCDPLNGQFDKHIPENVGEYYKNLKFADLPAEYAPAIEILRALAAVYEHKGDFGIRLKKAYDSKDTAALKSLHDECDTIISLVERAHETHRRAWMFYNKPSGFEVLDIRYGGVAARMKTAKALIGEYLAGNISKIDELEIPRLRADCLPDDGSPISWTIMGSYPGFVTVNVLN